jgi:hypothetical protein
MAMNRFVPQELTFEQGSDRIREALRKAEVDIDNTIVTSRDPWAERLREELRITNQPRGVAMWQLPVVLNQSLLFLQELEPGAVVPEHEHVRAAVFRLVISGSIHYNGTQSRRLDVRPARPVVLVLGGKRGRYRHVSPSRTMAGRVRRRRNGVSPLNGLVQI